MEQVISGVKRYAKLIRILLLGLIFHKKGDIEYHVKNRKVLQESYVIVGYLLGYSENSIDSY